MKPFPLKPGNTYGPGDRARMMSAAEAVAGEVNRAFPHKRPGLFSPLVNSSQGCEPSQVAADFADKDDWTALTPQWLNTVADETALLFLSDGAIRFYIAAYLVADLTGQLHSADPVFILVHGFDNASRGQKIWNRNDLSWTDLARSRWDGLSSQQTLAIVHYLEWKIWQANLSSPGIREALHAYWYRRISI